MGKKILVTGGTGFTGRYVVSKLCEAGYDVTCFIRPNSNTQQISTLPIRFCYGDLGDVSSLRNALSGKEILVNVASIGFGHAPGIVQACRESGVRRTLFFSTTALFTTLAASTKAIRIKAERAIEESGLEYTILRPTMIYGSMGDRNIIKLIRFIDKYPLIPIFGNGKSLQQPVFVDDLAKAVIQVLDTDKTIGKAYNLSGMYPLSYNEVVDIVANGLGRSVMKVHLPIKLSLLAVRFLSKIPGLPKITTEQVLRLNENKAFLHQEAKTDFGYQPISFEEGVYQEIAEYKKILR